MGKTVKILVGVAIGIAIAIAAAPLAGALLGALSITASATAMAVTTALVATGLAFAAGIAMRVLGLTTGAPRAQIGPPTVFRQSIANSFIVYGKRRVGGLMVFFHSRKSGSTHYRYFVIAVAGHRCQGVIDWMLGDEIVTVTGSDLVTTGPYANKAWLWFQNGDASETANATFVSECGGKWTTDHKGNGVAAIYAKFEMTDDAVQAGLPNITAVIEGKDDILDPRDDTTGYTRNAVLIFNDWMKMPREEGGFGAYADEIPSDEFISANANVCDEEVEGEPRYAIDAVITTGAAPSEVRDALIVNCAGTYAYSGGKYLMRPGYWVPSTETFTEADAAGPFQVSAFLPGDQMANEVQGTYISAADGYQGMPLATQTTDPAPSDIRQLDVDLAFTTNKHQGERVLRIMLGRAQCEKQVTLPLNIVGLKASALDTIVFNTTRHGLSNYAFQVAEWKLSADYGAILELREENADIYDDPAPVAAPTVPAIAVAEVVIRTSDLVALVSASFVTDADPADGLLSAADGEITIETHVRTYSDKPVSVTGSTITGLVTGTFYHVYYDDEAREGGGVTFLASDDPQDAATTPAQPGHHYVGSIVASAGQTAGGSSPPGWGDDTWHNEGPIP
jgi:hypothetical protein